MFLARIKAELIFPLPYPVCLLRPFCESPTESLLGPTVDRDIYLTQSPISSVPADRGLPELLGSRRNRIRSRGDGGLGLRFRRVRRSSLRSAIRFLSRSAPPAEIADRQNYHRSQYTEYSNEHAFRIRLRR